MKNICEASSMGIDAHVSCKKYQNLNNISHYHGDHELVLVNEGRASVTVNEKIFNLDANGCLFIHSNVIHCIQSSESTVITVLKANSKYFENIFGSSQLISPLLTKCPNVCDILNTIGAELEIGDSNSGIMADSIAAQLFVSLLRSEQIERVEDKKTSEPSTAKIYTELCKKISDEYSTLTFESAAAYMHLSEPYFSKVFHNIFGMTFTEYLNAVKITAAIEKLREGSLTVTEISSRCGFNTIRNFNRVFRSFTGYSPKNLPPNYVFLYRLKSGEKLNPTLNCTRVLSFTDK